MTTVENEDFMPGDPSLRVIGRQEKSARVHRPLEKKERKPTIKTIRADIKYRIQEIEPLVNEYHELTRFLAVVDAVMSERPS